MAVITNFKNEEGAIFNDQSQTMNVQQNVVQTVPESTEAETEDNVQTIRLASGFEKVELFRVIIALYKLGAFETVNGRKPSQISVFKAFGKMLGDNYDDYSNHLSSFIMSDVPEIFEDLGKAFVAYTEKKREKQEKQRR
jgi:hypothetical protein